MPTRNGKKLNDRERRFVDAYMGSCSGNATQAAKAAGYSAKTARVQGPRLLSRVAVAAELAKRADRATQTAIADADERDRRLTEILRDVDAGNAIRAAHELNKVSGRHSVLVNVKGKLTLEDALSLSREDEAGAE